MNTLDWYREFTSELQQIRPDLIQFHSKDIRLKYIREQSENDIRDGLLLRCEVQAISDRS